ncbi:hypothetical protein H8E88_14895 [candidate division KSB1 bacterium]|nr:hypothetical protein [candidate division KSB1 bacterium]MBL7112540.1 hypothetical protein [Bacteroidales bacterium]
MQTIYKILSISLIFIFLSCGIQSPNNPTKEISVKLNFNFVNTGNSGLFFSMSALSHGNLKINLSQTPIETQLKGISKINALQSIDEAKIVFYKFALDWDALHQNVHDNWDEIYSFIYSFEGEQTDFENYWVEKDLGEFSIYADGKTTVEKRSNLTISDSTAYGEFGLIESLKACRVGLYENGTLTYIGRSNGINGTGFFDVLADETINLDISLMRIY